MTKNDKLFRKNKKCVVTTHQIKNNIINRKEQYNKQGGKNENRIYSREEKYWKNIPDRESYRGAYTKGI